MRLVAWLLVGGMLFAGADVWAKRRKPEIIVPRKYRKKARKPPEDAAPSYQCLEKCQQPVLQCSTRCGKNNLACLAKCSEGLAECKEKCGGGKGKKQR